ncbi:MAG: DUF3576 domain-containing protein [Proteobacteria bacterium]|nr:DUF3576 domain-containing protein [Pseudomonadota bacterium]
MRRKSLFCLSVSLLSLALAGCDTTSKKEAPPMSAEENRKKGFGKLFGDDALTFGKKSKNEQGVAIGVNSFLWRATLDVLSFLPLIQADPFGGVIITDWYTPPSVPNERFKVDVLILDPQLRSDALRISIFHQIHKEGTWKEVPVEAVVINDLEEAILLKARHLRISSLNS